MVAKRNKAGPLKRAEVARLIAETLFDRRTIERWATDGKVRDSTSIVLARAARRLGLPVPEHRT